MSKSYSRYQEYFKTFLGGWTFEDGDKTLTIKEVAEEEMYDADTGGKKKGLAVRFVELDLPMVLNVTNAETIAEVVGSDRLSEWVGKRIIVGASKVKAFGKVYYAIRVRPKKPDDTVYVCEECGETIRGTTSRQPSQIAEISKRNTGRVLCVACMKKEAKANGQ